MSGVKNNGGRTRASSNDRRIQNLIKSSKCKVEKKTLEERKLELQFEINRLDKSKEKNLELHKEVLKDYIENSKIIKDNEFNAKQRLVKNTKTLELVADEFNSNEKEIEEIVKRVGGDVKFLKLNIESSEESLRMANFELCDLENQKDRVASKIAKIRMDIDQDRICGKQQLKNSKKKIKDHERKLNQIQLEIDQIHSIPKRTRELKDTCSKLVSLRERRESLKKRMDELKLKISKDKKFLTDFPKLKKGFVESYNARLGDLNTKINSAERKIENSKRELNSVNEQIKIEAEEKIKKEVEAQELAKEAKTQRLAREIKERAEQQTRERVNSKVSQFEAPTPKQTGTKLSGPQRVCQLLNQGKVIDEKVIRMEDVLQNPEKVDTSLAAQLKRSINSIRNAQQVKQSQARAEKLVAMRRQNLPLGVVRN